MARLTRQTHILFGGAGTSDNFAQFGSVIGPGVDFTKDIPTIQNLSAWTTGWQSAVYASNKAPFLEEMNGWCYEHSYQVAYFFQDGIAEWDANTTYFLNSIVKRAGSTELYGSLQDNNLNNAPPVQVNNAFWAWLNPPYNPPGTVQMFAGSSVPAGYLECDGTSYLRSAFPNLFTAIGTAWGTVDGTHFNVPDMRGVVPRGWNHGASDAFADPDASARIVRRSGGATGDNVGSFQQDEVVQHTHSTSIATEQVQEGSAGTFPNFLRFAGSQPPQSFTTDDGTPTGNETRGKNAYLMFIIKT